MSEALATQAGQSTTQGAEAREEFIQLLPAVRQFFVRRAGINEADDLTQEVFARLARVPDELPVRHAAAYVFQVAAHVIMDRRRRDIRRHSGAHVSIEEISTHPVEVSSPESILVHRDLLRRIAGIIDELPARVGDAFVLHRFEDMTYESIARRQGCSVSSVEKYIARATKHIAARLEEMGSGR